MIARRPTPRWSEELMRGLFIHTVVYAVVMALLVGAWLLTTGSTTELSHVQDDPLFAVQHGGFWPLIVGAVWGGALVIHAGVWLGSVLPGGRRRRRRGIDHRHGPR